MADVAQNLAGESWKFDPTYHHISDYLGIDPHEREDYGVANKVNVIRDWAGLNTKQKNLSEVVQNIHKLRRDLGTQNRGSSLINELYQAIRLDLDTNRTREKEQKKQTVEVRKKVEEVKVKPEEMNQKQIEKVFRKTLVDKDLIQSTVKQVIQDRVGQTVGKALDRILK